MKIKKQLVVVVVMSVFICGFLSMGNLYAQKWKQRLDKDRPTFQEIKDAFEKYSIENKGKRVPGWKQFRRWEWFAQNRLDKEGYFDPTLNWKGWLEKQERFGNNPANPESTNPVWTQLGPTTIPETFSQWGYAGMGRVNCIAFHPTNPDIMWVGSPAGGLWKTTTGGGSWTNSTDNLPNLGVSSILVHPQNPDTLYIATGDGDGADTFSIGVLKSTDGGNTWNPVGLEQDVAVRGRIHKLSMHPSNPNILLAGTSQGIHRSSDGGETWDFITSPAHFKDFDVNKSNPSIWYASAFYYGVYKSTDAGENWTRLTNGLPQPQSGFGRVAVAVADSSPSIVYALYTNYETGGFWGLYRSADAGASWQLQANTPNLLGWDVYGNDFDSGGQGSYDLTLDVDPTNPDTVYVGGINMWKSYNGGKNWEVIAHWYGALGNPFVHADHHDFKFHPNDHNTIFSGNDGGLHKSTDGGASWTDLSSGLAIHQIYRMGQSATNADKFVIGNQDNGSDLYNAGTWYSVYGGDGMECAIDPENDSNMYCSVYYGSFSRSSDGGQTWQSISGPFSGNGAWVTPFLIDPKNSSTLYVATDTVYKSTAKGVNWEAISGKLVNNDTFIAMAVSPTNTDYIYVSTLSSTIFRTTNGGTGWTQVTNPIPGNTTTTWLTVDPHNPTTLWRTYGGYITGQKVFRSTNGGETWENLTGMLPNVPANCLIIDPDSGTVYVGTDLGVFCSPGGDRNWIAFDNGLPNVIVNDLEFHMDSKKIRAATYGRGVWESPLAAIPVIFPPVNLSGEKFRNKSLMQKEYLDELTWEANPKNDPEKVSRYRIYKRVENERLQIAEVDAGTFRYWVRKAGNEENTYYISTINDEDIESTMSFVRVTQ